MTTKGQAAVIVREIVITSTDGEQGLVVQLDIDCSECGITQGMIYGHHLRTLHQALGMVIERHGALCGDIGEIKETTEFHGGNAPGREVLN